MSHTSLSTENSKSNDKTLEQGKRPSIHGRQKTVPIGIKGRHSRRQSLTDQTNKEALRELEKSLSKEDKLQLDKFEQDYKLEKELKKTMAQLQESKDQCNEAVEIIGNLERENEELRDESYDLKETNSRLIREIKILDEKLKVQQELFMQEKTQYEEVNQQQQEKLQQMEEVVVQQNSLLEQQEHQHKRHQSKGDDDDFDDDDVVDSKKKLHTKTEKKLFSQYQEERRRNIQYTQQMEKLLEKLEDMSRLIQENERLKQENEQIHDLAQEEIERAGVHSKSMENEVIKLASRNAQLEKEKLEMQRMLEERDYETQMLKTHLDMHQTSTTNLSKQNSQYRKNINNFDDLDQMLDQEPDDYDDYQYEESQKEHIEEKEKEKVIEKPKQEEKLKDVPDVLKEYLHLTASAVKIKFPRVNTIDSQDLINKVSHLNFFDYYDHMMRIMRNEEQKLKREEDEKQKLNNPNPLPTTNNKKNTQGTTLFDRFRNWSNRFYTYDTKNPNSRPKTDPKTKTTITTSSSSSSSKPKIKSSTNVSKSSKSNTSVQKSPKSSNKIDTNGKNTLVSTSRGMKFRKNWANNKSREEKLLSQESFKSVKVKDIAPTIKKRPQD